MIDGGRVTTAVERCEGTRRCSDDKISNSTRQLCKAYSGVPADPAIICLFLAISNAQISVLSTVWKGPKDRSTREAFNIQMRVVFDPETMIMVAYTASNDKTSCFDVHYGRTSVHMYIIAGNDKSVTPHPCDVMHCSSGSVGICSNRANLQL